MSTKSLLITDLDNTLWDWFAAWHASFSALLTNLERLSGIPASQLEPEIRRIHQLRGTSEYSYLLNEIPSLLEASGDIDPLTRYDEAVHAQNSARIENTHLYPGVESTLLELRSRGFMVVAFTESVAYWTEWRIRHTGLDGLIDVLYSAPDHDLPTGVTFESLRRGQPDDYGLKSTEHRHIPKGEVKPSEIILRSILKDCDKTPEEAIYVGDSKMKDIAMAQSVDVTDVHAKYGEPQQRPEYALLQRVSHWPDRDVQREQHLTKSREVSPTHVLNDGFDGLLDLLDTEGALGWPTNL